MTPRLRAAVLVCGLALAPSAGCRQRSSDAAEPAPAQDEVPQVRHFPGVEVVRMTGGGVRIRMIGGVLGSKPPLYVVDGAAVRVSRGGGIEWLDLDYIVNVQVLRDPAETAVYGPRGSGGVIVITTTIRR